MRNRKWVVRGHSSSPDPGVVTGRANNHRNFSCDSLRTPWRLEPLYSSVSSPYSSKTPDESKPTQNAEISSKTRICTFSQFPTPGDEVLYVL